MEQCLPDLLNVFDSSVIYGNRIVAFLCSVNFSFINKV